MNEYTYFPYRVTYRRVCHDFLVQIWEMVITCILLLRAVERWQHGVLNLTRYIATEIRITLLSFRQIAAKWETILARCHAANIGTAALADLKVEFCHRLQLQKSQATFLRQTCDHENNTVSSLQLNSVAIAIRLH
jgi:hypothetical protein